MSFSSKSVIVSMVAGIILVAAYIIYALGEHSPAPEDLKAWAIAMLCFIGISVVVAIVIQILFHIAAAIGIAVKEHGQGRTPDENVEREISSQMVEDEMGKLISLKAGRVGHLCAGMGAIAVLVTLALGMPAVFALHILFGAFAFSSMTEGIVSVYYYEKGVRNG